MLKKIQNSRRVSSLIGLFVMGVTQMFVSEADAAEKCLVGIYPVYDESTDSWGPRQCAKVLCAFTCWNENECYTWAENGFGSPSGGWRAIGWELFYKDFNSGLKNKEGKIGLSCKEWMLDCRMCGRDNKPVRPYQKKALKKPAVKKPEVKKGEPNKPAHPAGH